MSEAERAGGQRRGATVHGRDNGERRALESAISKLGEAAEAIVAASGQAFYVWDIRTDDIEWSRNFASLAGLADGETRHLKGRTFEAMLSSRSQETRFGVIISAAGNSDRPSRADGPVPYQCVYCLHPSGTNESPPLWIEDTGCWYPGRDGRPDRAEGSVRVINDRRRQEEDLRRKSDFDDLTGLPNRRSLERLLEKSIRESESRGTVSSFLILAIDRMDTINDTYGFSRGDMVLAEAARRIASRLRADDIVCRLSGAKFGLVLRDCPPAEIFDAANRVLDALSADPIRAEDALVPVSAMIGACFLPRHASSAGEAMGIAFKALRKVHDGATSRIAVYAVDPSSETVSRRRAALSSAILAMLQSDDRGGLSVSYTRRGVLADGSALMQPRLSIDPEALGIGDHAGSTDLAMLGRELGLMRQIDLGLLQEVLDALERDSRSHYVMDVSRHTIVESRWMQELASRVAAIEPCASRLVIGLDESFALSGSDEATATMESIGGLGCRIKVNRFSFSPIAIAQLPGTPASLVMADPRVLAAGYSDTPEGHSRFLKSAFALVRSMGIDVIETDSPAPEKAPATSGAVHA